MQGKIDIMADAENMTSFETDSKGAAEKRPHILHIVLVACTVGMFVYLGGSVGGQLVRQYAGNAPSADQAMVSALLLNIALILLVWRRTTHVGCALSAAGAEEILVCRYSSSGNVIGQHVL